MPSITILETQHRGQLPRYAPGPGRILVVLQTQEHEVADNVPSMISIDVMNLVAWFSPVADATLAIREKYYLGGDPFWNLDPGCTGSF
jgi:hypothetical protein